MSTRFTVRPARPDDLERLIALHQVAFPDARGATERTRNFRSNRLGQFEDLRLLCDGDQVLGHAFLFPLECAFGGRWVASAGIASVGVSPHARGGGAARTLLEALHEEAVRRGFAISLLYPFRQAFYASLGYAPVSPYRALSLSPHAIPDAWRRQAAGAVREADGRDRDGIVACYERAALRGTGMVKRTPAA